MTLTGKQLARAKQWAQALPGARGRDIPPHIYDTIYSVGNGVTMSVWGRPILPQQIDWLYRTGAHTPQQIHEALGKQQHPHAPAVTVAEYPHYAKALQTYRKHR